MYTLYLLTLSPCYLYIGSFMQSNDGLCIHLRFCSRKRDHVSNQHVPMYPLLVSDLVILSRLSRGVDSSLHKKLPIEPDLSGEARCGGNVESANLLDLSHPCAENDQIIFRINLLSNRKMAICLQYGHRSTHTRICTLMTT